MPGPRAAFFDTEPDNGILKGVKYVQASFDQKAPDILPQLKAYRLVKESNPGRSPGAEVFRGAS